MKIAVIGAGLLGGTVAQRFASAEHDMRVCNSRGPASVADSAQLTGTFASMIENVFGNAGVAIIAAPFQNVVGLLKAVVNGCPRL